MRAYHDAASGSIERGNTLGDRSTVRQSRYFRQYESGNNVKSLLGTDNLMWDVNKKEGVFSNHAVYDGAKQDYDYGAVAAAQQPPMNGIPAPIQPLNSMAAAQQPLLVPRYGRRASSNNAQQSAAPPSGFATTAVPLKCR